MDPARIAEYGDAACLERAEAVFSRALSIVSQSKHAPTTHADLGTWLQQHPGQPSDFPREVEYNDIVYFSTYQATEIRGDQREYPNGINQLHIALPNGRTGPHTVLSYYHRSHLLDFADPTDSLSDMPTIRAFAERFFGGIGVPVGAFVAYTPPDQRLDVRFEARPRGQPATRLWISFEDDLPAYGADTRKHYKEVFGSDAAKG